MSPTTPSAAAPTSGFVPPSSPIHRQIQRILWISLGLCAIIFGLTMVHFGYLSMFISFGALGLTLIHHITILALSHKEHKAGPETLAGKLPATARKATIICGWLIMIVWAASVGWTMSMVIIMGDWGDTERKTVIVGHLEWVFELFEVVVMGLLALKCTRERQRIVGLANTAWWYQLGSYAL
ncbi:hypothetical protein NLJ89_g6415 [Agrocybe chaxingu]|uniref:Uncharacterized protein n=1 Tax=Agrocybe chaxingu TaxID=84603 RepID=A0A9W8JZ66_9AGAR|nr:hypothetical protein NLJ89_g6415 [Agrocybe chaxingu]